MSSPIYSVSCTAMASGLAQAVAGVGYFGIGGQMPLNINNLQITVCTETNNAITLPNNAPNGTVISIRNDGNFFIQIFPYFGGSIDGQTVNTEVYIAQLGGQKSFICNGTNTWLTMQDNGIQPIFSLVIDAGDNEDLVGCASFAGTLSRAHSNGIILLDNLGDATINLPPVATSRGIKYNFTVGVGTHPVVIQSATNVLNGVLQLYIADTHADETSTGVIKTDSANYTHQAAGLVGDWSTVHSDGVRWYCSGASGNDAGFA